MDAQIDAFLEDRSARFVASKMLTRRWTRRVFPGVWMLWAASGTALLGGCDRLAKLDPSRTDALEARVQAQEAVIGALQAEMTGAKGQVLNLHTRLEDVEQQLAARSQAKARSGPASFTQDQVASLNAVIADCVKLVRTSAPRTGGPLDEIQDKFWTGFDAYYSPASGRVENNVMYNGERPALYAFNKCMNAKGMPLS